MDALLQQLQAMEIDPPGTRFTFARRLAAENSWSPDFARRVLNEYKKFVYLAVKAGHPVTPSDAVDQVWHLHLCYTDSYWNVMCKNVLQQPLHHGPTRGGKTEAAKYSDWYQQTLASYVRTFQASPPDDIWPTETRRFSEIFRRVSTTDCLIIRKRYLGIGALFGLALTLGGCGILGVGGEGFPGILLIIFVLVVFAAILRMLFKSGRGGRGGGCGGAAGCGGSSDSSSSDHGGNSGADGSGDGGGSGCGGGGD